MHQKLRKSVIGVLIFLLMIPTIVAAGPEMNVQQQAVETAEIEVFSNKWSVISSVYDSIVIDGDLSESTWETGERLESWENVYHLTPVEQEQAVQIRYDDDSLYIGISYESEDQGDSLKNVDVLISPESSGQAYYRIPIEINPTALTYGNNWGPNITTVQPQEKAVQVNDGIVTAEAAVALTSLGESEIIEGEEWRLNVLFTQQRNTKPLSSWIPVRTSSTTYIGAGSVTIKADVSDEGRLGSVFMGGLPASMAEWTPASIQFDYAGYREKQLSFEYGDLDPQNTTFEFRWKAPGEAWVTLEGVQLDVQGERLQAIFEHPAPRNKGLYQIQIHAADGEGTIHSGMISFDRRAMIDAGDSLYTPEQLPAEDKIQLELAPPSERVQELLDLIPDQPGFLFTGLPDQPDLVPTGNNYNWDPENPDQMTSAFSGMVFPNEQYPEDQVLRVQNALGEWVEVPYYEDEEGRQYFITAHRWYKQRDYVVGQLQSIANEDPLGAARLLHRFAEVAEGYVPTNDYRWYNNIVDPAIGPPYEYWGGMWYRWAAADLIKLPQLSNTYAIVNQTNAFDLLRAELDVNVHDEVVDMMLASVDFYHTFPIIYSNMEYHNMLGLIALAKALNDPKYIHEVVEWTQHFAMSTYLFDGFYKEVTISYHNQSTNGVNMVLNALKGWTDPEGYVSPRTGTRYENLDLQSEFSALNKAAEIPHLLVYPNGQNFPMHDTWASDRSARPQLDAGSFLLPASGIARLARGFSETETIDPTFGIVTDFADMDVVQQSAETRYFSNSGTIQFEAESTGHYLTYAFDAPEADTYEIALKPFRAGSYGVYDVLVDDERIGEVNFHSPSGGQAGVGGYETLGTVELTPGTHEITFLGTGKAAESTNYKLGLIQLALLDEQARQDRDEWEDNAAIGTAEPMQVYTTFIPRYGHHQHDPLNLALFAKGQELLPDLGYTHTLYRQWTNSTMAHNTVVVNSRDASSTGAARDGGNIDTFVSDETGIQTLRATYPTAYAVDEYTREPWMIPFLDDPKQGGYVLDLFRVYGGERHEYTLSGDANRDGFFETELPLEDYGPYLLPEGVDVREPEGELDQGSAEGHYYGYIYVRDVEKADIQDGKYEVTLRTEDDAGEELSGVKITGLVESGQNELFIGESPSMRATRTLGSAYDNNIEAQKYVMPKMVVRRDGNDLHSNFINVMEPFDQDTEILIDQIERLELEQSVEGDIAVAVSYGNVTDIVLSSMDPTSPLVVDDMTLVGKMGLIRMKDGQIDSMHLIGGTLLKKGSEELTDIGSYSGQIVDVLRRADGAEIDGFVLDTSVSADMAGSTIVVTHPNGKTHGYEILNVADTDGGSMVELNDMDPGFTMHADGTSSLNFYPFTAWSGETTFRIENTVRKAPDTDGDEEISVSAIKEHLAHYESEGAFANAGAVRSLSIHLTSVGHFESQGEMEKVASHMGGFLMLLEHQLEQQLMTEEAYQALKTDTEALIASLE